MISIQINVADKRASVAGAPVIVCGNRGYTIKFIFDSEWGSNTAKTARFVYMSRGEVKYADVVFTGDTVDVPVMANIREVRVGVFEGDLRTTTPAVIPCKLSIRCSTGAPADPTPSQYDQIMELLSNLPAGGGGTSIDVTAKVGQGIVVKEVDANGKPTAWKSADFVQTTAQTLTEEQKAQARTNIGVSAGGGLTLSAIYLLIDILQHANYTEDMSSQIERLADALMGGGNTDGGFNITDDGNGNVTITTWGSATITDDGSGNVTIIAPGDASITDDGNGNFVIA